MPISDVNNPSTASRLLRSNAWDMCVDARLLRASEPWDEAPEFRAHGHSLRRLFTDPELTIDAVLCIEGRPSVCIKDARQFSADKIEGLRRRLWNMGAATLLVVECQSDIKVFSTLVKPTIGDHEGNSARLPNETIQNLRKVDLALRLKQCTNRFLISGLLSTRYCLII